MMKKACILLIVMLICFDLKAKKQNNYIGINGIYNQASLINSGTKGSGYGVDFFYQSFFTESFSYKVVISGLYNSFDVDTTEQIYNSLTSSYENINYQKNEVFYNFIGGFLLNYNFILAKILNIQTGVISRITPYIGTGLFYSFIYKKISYTYDDNITSFIDTQEQNRWLPASLAIPLNFGIDFLVFSNNVISLECFYLLMTYDATTKNYAYENVLNFKLGYKFFTDFKL